MLILTRKRNQAILIGDDIRIKVTSIEDGKVRIGIDAPASVVVDREEVRKAKAKKCETT